MRVLICFLATMLSSPLQAQEQELEAPTDSAELECVEFPLACNPPNPPSWGGSGGGIAVQENPEFEIDMQAVDQQLQMMDPDAEFFVPSASVPRGTGALPEG